MPEPTSAGDVWLPLDGGKTLTAAPCEVVRVDPDTGGIEAMIGLEAIDVDRPSGAKPRTARIAYVFSDTLGPEWPHSLEEALSTRSDLPKVVKPGDRLLIRMQQPDGTWGYIFDGKPYGFAAIGDEGHEEVVLECIGCEKDLWDTPIAGAIHRNADTPTVPGAAGSPNHAQTDDPAIFNEGAQPNCTPDGADYADNGAESDRPVNETRYPVFLDPLVVRTEEVRTYWTLPKAVQHLLQTCNGDEAVVTNPTRSALFATLVAREPKDGVDFDPEDPETYDAKDIRAPEVPITGRAMPPLVEGLIADKGFAFDFRLVTTDGIALPTTEIDIYATQTAVLKDLWLQPRGEDVDIQRSNIGACHITRDVSEATNRWEVRGAAIRHEGAFVLAPLFPMASSDGPTTFSLNTVSTEDRIKYRGYGFDETGDGHYAVGTATKLTNVPSLDAIFGDAAHNDGKPTYARRRRPASGDLISTKTVSNVDSARLPQRLPAQLAYSRDYVGPVPGVWDGTGTWKVIHGGFTVLHDRLGIFVNVENPEEWQVGDHEGPKDILRGVTSQSLGAPPNTPFTLRLVTVIEADQCLKGVADRRDKAILAETVTRFVEARDRYKKEIVHKGTPFNNSSADYIPRDDSEAITAEAISIRDATDAGLLDGPVVLPWFTSLYAAGDRIRKINGRDLGLRTDGDGEGKTPIYPCVTHIHWQLRGVQTTTLSLSDRQSYRKGKTRGGTSGVKAVAKYSPEWYAAKRAKGE